ncbi:MAG TPA: RDD family protein [Acidimicrobiales bacterium]
MTPPSPLDRVFGAIVPRAVDAIDIDDVIGQVDVDHLVSEVDVDALVQRVDVDALIQRVDVGKLIERVDLDEVLTKVDLNTLMGGVDLDALLTKVDLNTLMGKVDLDKLLAEVDIEALMKRAKIDQIVSNASRGVFAQLMDAVRRQLAGLDALLIGVVTRVFRRPRMAASLVGGTLSGQVAGGISRLTAFLIDAGVISVSYGLTAALMVFMVGLLTGNTVDPSNHALPWLTGYVMFAFFYYWIGLAITGRSIGKGLIGLRVVQMDGEPITPGRAAVRTIVYPFSFILGLGLLPIVVGKQRRALHDFAGGDHVLYDWGDRPAELPAPLTDWVRRRGLMVGEPVAAAVESAPDAAD